MHDVGFSTCEVLGGDALLQYLSHSNLGHLIEVTAIPQWLPLDEAACKALTLGMPPASNIGFSTVFVGNLCWMMLQTHL